MGKKLYVGNLSYTVTDEDLRQLFSAHGGVQSAQIIMDRESGRSKGFGFVEMLTDQDAQAAIAALHGKDCQGRTLAVNEARPREPSTATRSGGRYGPRGAGRQGGGPPRR